MSFEQNDGLEQDMRRFTEAWTVLYAVFVPSIGKIILSKMRNERYVLTCEDWGDSPANHKQYFDANDPAVELIDAYMREVLPTTQAEYDAIKQEIENIILVSHQRRS